MKKVKLTAPGILAVGEFQADEEYEVEDDLAKFLVDVKGFEYVSGKATTATNSTVTESGV